MPDKLTTRPRLVLDGTEGIEGRVLLLLSALHHCAPSLAGWNVALLGAEDSAVLAAAEALHWDTGLSIAPATDGATALAGARLYAAVAFRTTRHLPLAQLAAMGVPSLIAVQFPEQSLHGVAELALLRAAHDPVRLAEKLREQIGAV
jgi:hypothetical protein